MNFWFSDADEQKAFFSLRGLTNRNNGFYVSLKQAQYLGKVYRDIVGPDGTIRYGVDIPAGRRVVTLQASMRWTDYGTRSIIPMMYMFVLDDYGVTDFYRIGGNGNLRDGWSPDPSKVKQMWTRPTDAAPTFSFPTEQEVQEQASQEPVGTWIGNPGDTVTGTMTLVNFRDLGMGQFGPMMISVFRDTNGNTVNVWKNFNLTPGQTVEMSGKVKSCDEYNGKKQTTLTRVKISECSVAA